MSRPTVWAGLALAGMTALATVVVSGWDWLLYPGSGVRVAIVLTVWAQLAHLLYCHPRQLGAITLAAANLLAGILLIAGSAGVVATALVAVAATSVNRGLLCHRGLPAAAMDAGLSILGLLLGAYLYRHSGSLAMAVWGFLLVQAAWVLIPGPAQSAEGHPTHGVDAFVQGRRQAESALERIERRAPGF